MHNILIRFFILICAIGSFIGTQAQSAADAVVANALNGGNPFELLRAYEASRDSLSPMIGCFAKAMIANDFNNPAEACMAIDSLVENHQDEIGLGSTMTMIYLKAANMAKEGRYAEASQVLANVIPTDFYICWLQPQKTRICPNCVSPTSASTSSFRQARC